MSFPKDDLTTYYLQNSFSKRYLYVSGSSVMLSAQKVEDVFYRWRFIKDQKTSHYILQNVGNHQYISNAGTVASGSYLGYHIVSLSNTAQTLNIVLEGSVFKMNFNDQRHYSVSDVNANAYGAARTYWQQQNQPGRDQWHFEAQSIPLVIRNPLPTGNYRIRTFNGGYLLTMPQAALGDVANSFVTEQDQNSNFQKWLLVPEGDSLYTIRNSGTGLYLAGASDKLVKGALLIGQYVANGETPFHWRIETFGPGVMFFIRLQDNSLSVGFSKYMAEDLSQVALQPSDNIPSQIWFFETFEPLSPATYHITQQLVSGTYILENCHSQQYLSISTDDFIEATSDHTEATKFTLEFVANYSPNFTLSYLDANYGTFYLSVEKKRLVTSDEDEKSTWVLLPREYQGVGTVYFIRDSTPTDPCRVISCRKIKDRKRSYFAVDAMTEGEAMQFWKFHRVETGSSMFEDGSSA